MPQVNLTCHFLSGSLYRHLSTATKLAGVCSASDEEEVGGSEYFQNKVTQGSNKCVFVRGRGCPCVKSSVLTFMYDDDLNVEPWRSLYDKYYL